MANRTLTRRHLLTVTGGIVAIGVAGCLEEQEEQNTGEEDDNHSNDHNHDHDNQDDDHDHDHDHDHNHELGHPEEQITVQMETQDDGSHHFVPHIVHIEPNGTVEWELTSGEHNTVAYHPDNEDVLPSVAPLRMPEDVEPWAGDLFTEEGETFEWSFDVEGIYDYVCRPHEAMGMTGRVIVGWPDPDSDTQPALEPPQDGLPDDARHQFEEYNERTLEVLQE